MSGNLKLNTSSGGSIALTPADTVSNITVTVPATAGTLLTTATSGSVLQVVSTTKTDSFSLAATNTFTDITGLSAAITPSNSANKVLVTVSIGAASMSNFGTQAYRLVRDSTAIGVGTVAGTRQAASFRDANGNSDGNFAYGGYSFSFLDSPSTTSATTYKLQLIVQTGTGYINRSVSDSDTDNPWGTRTASTITLMEIVG
jgi:hypothetical protein